MIQYQLKSKQTEPTTFNMALSLSRIVFMGTPEFAVESLDAMIKAGFTVVGVVTAPDKPAGRGMKMNESAVKKYALKRGLKILQPEKLKNEQFLSELRSLDADLQVVVAFRMLPEVVWNMPSKGTINLHASLLPQYRGAAPINWAIINGEKETGVTTFKLQQEIDTGNILLQEKIEIGDNETAGELHDRMKEIGARLLVDTIKGIVEGTLQELPQQNTQQSMLNDQFSSEDTHSPLTTPSVAKGLPTAQHHSQLKHAPKITTQTCQIDWQRSVDEIYNLIRGLSPYPAAFTDFGDKTLKVFRSEKEHAPPTSRPGRWETDRKTYLKFACSDGYIHVKDIQVEGKKRMGIEDFLRGYRF
ncbi:MAG TPA: methionyl-tRNA formyltransferase [Chitinophagaceae bacterium]|nr:methionyl-tRNA formyltransferase [Chitinophagaceae bacterium]